MAGLVLGEKFRYCQQQLTEDGAEMGSAVEWLKNQSASHVTEADAHLISLSKGLLERSPGKNDNWIEANGGLPAYVEEVANSLHTKKGMPISRAIAVALNQIKKWAVTGEPDTKAKAVKALAEWNALKAKAAAKRAAK